MIYDVIAEKMHFWSVKGNSHKHLFGIFLNNYSYSTVVFIRAYSSRINAQTSTFIMWSICNLQKLIIFVNTTYMLGVVACQTLWD